jgi:hypothetical protein
MPKRFLITLLTCLIAVSVSAQDTTTPDYAIRNIRSRFAENNQQTLVEFEVWNIGATATKQSTASLKVISTGQEIATDLIPPLKSQEIITVSLRFPTDLFAANTVESLRASIGVDEVEANGSENIQNNFAQISITFPAVVSTPQTTLEAPGGEVSSGGDVVSTAAAFLKQYGIQLDLNNPLQIIVLVSLCAAALVLLLIVFILIRVIFQRPPDMGNWQPSYVNLLPLDPNSAAGRRQQWQGHAQNNSLPAYGAEGGYHARKLAAGADGVYLAKWRVDAIRMCQYDMYGRVARSQMLMPRKAANRLNGVIRKRTSLTEVQIRNRLRFPAKILVNSFKKKWNERNVMLPIALDLRLKGKHGDVRIVFELYQFRGAQWALLDRWEPEMPVTGKMLQETYTYTLYGQRPSETTREFRRRLQDDLVEIFAEFIAITPPSQPHNQAPTNPNMQAVNLG